MKGRATCPKCKHSFILNLPDDKKKHEVECPNCKSKFTIKLKDNSEMLNSASDTVMKSYINLFKDSKYIKNMLSDHANIFTQPLSAISNKLTRAIRQSKFEVKDINVDISEIAYYDYRKGFYDMFSEKPQLEYYNIIKALTSSEELNSLS